MNQQEKDDFQWVSQRLAEVALGLRDPHTKMISVRMASMLESYFFDAFPGEHQEFKRRLERAKKEAKTKLEEIGPLLWGEMHSRALKARQISTEMVWLMQLANRLPCGECKQFYMEQLTTNPPLHVSTYFEWTVNLHNAVNRKLGKPEMDVEEARTAWRLASTTQ